MPTMRLAIIGAGPAGTAAAWGLRQTQVQVTLVEKSRGYTGRAATRRRGAVSYDHGANYFKTSSERLRRLVFEELPADALEQIRGDVWTFDGQGRIEPGDPERDRGAKWTYRDGINTLGKLLAGASGAEVRLQTRVQYLHHDREGWHLVTTDEERIGPFDAVLVTPPAPQAADLLAESTMEGALRDRLEQALRSARYRTQLSVVLGYAQRLERSGAFYALLNTDRQHAAAWIGFEEDKPGHVPDDESVLVVQMAPAWSRPRYEAPDEQVVQEAYQQAASVLGTLPGPPAWSDVQRWRYALPDEAADAQTLGEGAATGLFFAGDGLRGHGRVEAALESGLHVADSIRAYLAPSGRTS